MTVIQTSTATLALIAATLSFALSGCGLSDRVLSQAQETRDTIDRRARDLEASQKDFEQFRASDAYEAFGRAADREQWSEHLDNAENQLALADSTFQSEVQPILDQNDGDQGRQLLQALDKISPMLNAARQGGGLWSERRKLIEEASNDADGLRSRAASDWEVIRDGFPALQATASKASREFPDSEADIQRVIAPVADLLAESQAASTSIEREFGLHDSGGNADLGLLLTDVDRLKTNRDGFGQLSAEVEAKLAELSVSYSKTLVDMKADFLLNIRRQSWDESADSPPLHNLDYAPRAVDSPTFEHFDAIPGSLARYKKGWISDDFSLLSGVDANRWNSLKLDSTERWPRSDNEAEYWLETATEQYFHKYHIVQNGEVSETAWVPVAAAFFFANLDNLGMDVESKPYGVFEENKLTHAAPPGMAYVGNSRYGRWERRGGGMVWSWLGPYLFYSTLFGNPYRYSRNEWNSWHGGYYGRRAYYGGTSAAPAYGTRSRGTQSSSTFSGSNFGRSGGFGRPAGSVRGAGPASRGGAFGGSGK